MSKPAKLCECGCGEPLEGRQKRWRSAGHRDRARTLACQCGRPKESRRGARYCKDCRIVMTRAAQERAAEAARIRQMAGRRARGIPARDVDGLTHRDCKRCGATKPVAEMRLSKGKPSKVCLDCYPEQMHEYRLSRVFGITLADYYTMLAEQNGVCSICQKQPGKRRLAVDHNHKTGEIRGLLCTRCNHKLLGSSDEDAGILRRAADYLDSPPFLHRGHVIPSGISHAQIEKWLRQVEAEAPQGCLPLLAVRRPGLTDPGDWWAVCRWVSMLELLREEG